MPRGSSADTSTMKRDLKQEWAGGAAVGLGLFLLVLALFEAGAFEWLELRSYDVRYALTPPSFIETPVLLVRIDDETEARLNVRATDIPRSLYAEAVRRMAQAGAAVIALDVVFSRPRDPDGDEALAKAIGEAGNVILARYIGEQGHKVPLPMFQDGALGEGLINMSLDRDGVLRRVPLVGLEYGEDDGEPVPVLAISLEIARHYRGSEGNQDLDLDDPSEVKVGPLRVPYPSGLMRIAFYGPPGTFPRMHFWEAVRGEFDPEAVNGKIVLIGASAPSLHDYYQTPFTTKVVETLLGTREDEGRGVRMDGFEIHANALQTILDGRFVDRSKDHRGLVPALLAVVGLVGTLWLIATRKSVAVVTGLGLGFAALIVGVALALFRQQRYFLDIVPLLTLVAGQYGAGVAYQRHLEGFRRRQVQMMFGRYVSRQVVEQLIRNPDLANPSGRKERLSIFFSDVRGFTSMSEDMEPQDTQRMLSEYFTEMTQILFNHGGTLDKFMGDAVMAFFGNPEPQPDHALRAVRMALEMQDAVARLNLKWASEGRRSIGVGMGINTGEVTVGNLGSTQFLNYTIIGDAVNLACRLEQYAKAGEVIITQATYEEVRSSVEAEPLEPIHVKGKREPIQVYRVRGLIKT